jgi:hypothetical protein
MASGCTERWRRRTRSELAFNLLLDLLNRGAAAAATPARRLWSFLESASSIALLTAMRCSRSLLRRRRSSSLSSVSDIYAVTCSRSAKRSVSKKREKRTGNMECTYFRKQAGQGNLSGSLLGHLPALATFWRKCCGRYCLQTDLWRSDGKPGPPERKLSQS